MSTSREQRRRARELAAAMRELDRLDREHGLGTMPGTRPVRRKRRGGSTALTAFITVVAVVGFVLVAPGDDMRALRHRLGIGPTHHQTFSFTPGEGEFAFAQTQLGSDDPVGYDPCQPIDYAVNPAGAPADWRRLVDTAISDTARATGLDFHSEGTTDLRPFDANRVDPAFTLSRPVVIGFGTADEFPALGGDVAGLGGSVATSVMGRLYYKTGAVALDTDVFTDARAADQPDLLVAILDHELGHVVGLGHVASPGELMNAQASRTTYAPGDLEGLARLGQVPCI